MIRDILTESGWQMAAGERLIVVGVAAMLRPDTILEVGVLRCKCSYYLSKFCGSLVCVDKQKLNENDALFTNMTQYTMLSDAAFEMFRKEGRYFDLIIVDADHLPDPAYRDLSNAIILGKHIIVHDTHNEGCRNGYKKAITENSERIAYHNLELTPGAEYPVGSWGGLGLVITKG